MKVLVIGSGAREHAIAWKLRQSPQVSELYVAPGNAGTAQIAQNLPIPASHIEALADAAQSRGIDLVVVGPEAPLAAGIVDHFQSRGIAIFGPTQAAARIEASKVFAKEIMDKYGIPCAKGVVFSSYPQARSHIKAQLTPIVVKADGLAAGKGVMVAHTREEALEALANIMEKRVFGPAGDWVIVEECLMGREASLLAFTDGHIVVPMVPARDYKRLGDNDEGPNTGGMGSYSPPSFIDASIVDNVKKTIFEPTIRALAQEAHPYKGVLYAGLMITAEGPKVLEFNCRFGDPETQVILPRLKTDLVDVLLAVLNGTLDKVSIQWSEEACVGAVMASQGYPGSYATGSPITGFDCLDENIIVFHAGTKSLVKDDGQMEVVTDGGRVLTVVALGKTLAEAHNRVYLNVPCLRFEGSYYRHDIAADEIVG
ncbi:MAG: phosphoribosylamine--glycine ligase [Chloroflexi bacterium]|nr:phosphoribosylamine--glycine ligase [Chloroflexota bacterium]